MRKLRILFISLLFAWNYILPFNAPALEKATHFDLNGIIVSKNKANLNNYFNLNLGFSKGVEEIINGKQVIKWIQEGGIKEDEPGYSRSLNHFHNPLKTWDSAGFKGTFQSSVIWAQDQGAFGSLWGGNFSWKADREYYYIALTGRDFSGTIVAPTQAERETYFGKTFQGIGQVMHLVEDVSVPAHTRNDAHVISYHYELAVDKFRMKGEPVFTTAVASPITFNPSILSLPPNGAAPIPIAKIFDIDLYNSINPDPNVTASSAIGISEYTNANFVSEGLLSANFQDFPFPRIEDTTIIEKSHTGNYGKYMRQYYLKNCCGETNSGQGYLLAAVDYFDYWRKKYPILSSGLPIIPVLDDNVYKDYASLLIPRAVGYSAGLLNYFFRGEMDMVADDVTGPGYVIVNNTDEDMSGTFELWYDNKDDERVKVSGASWTLAIGKKSSGNNKSTNTNFTPPPDAKEPGKYMLVFRGKLGSEEDAVVGKELSPPPIVFLIYQDAYAVWSISKNGKELKDVEFDIPKYVNLISPAQRNFPSTVKSNSELNEHIAMVKNFQSQPDPKRYGVYKQDADGYSYLFGLRSSYVDDVFDNSYAYFEYNTNLDYPPAYVCSGRNNWYKENKNIISDLELWKIGTDKFQTKYKVNGVATNGITIDSAKDAILSKTKFIGYDYDSVLPPYTSYGITCVESEIPSSCSGYCSCNFQFCSGTDIFYGGGSPYKFGEVELERSGSMYRKIETAPTPVIKVYHGKEYIRYVTGGSVDIESYSLSNLSLLDYDNIMDENLNPDKTFIIFYATSGIQHRRTISDLTHSLLMEPCPASDIDFYGNRTKYILAYRIKGAGLNKIEICSLGAGTTFTDIDLFVLSDACVSDECQQISTTQVTETSGQRINDISSKVSDNYLVYSYILEDYTGPNDPLWTFNKRILGIVDIKTGTRTEYEVNDNLLGRYKDTFNRTLPSAIGLHNGSVK